LRCLQRNEIKQIYDVVRIVSLILSSSNVQQLQDNTKDKTLSYLQISC